MQQLIRKVCLFLFLTAVLSERANELGTLVGALAGTILLWPVYRKYAPAPPERRRAAIEHADENEAVTATER